MHESVRDVWHQFSEPLEGRVHSIYVDILGLCTTGVGNLIDPVHLALEYPWKLPDGSLASKDEIRRQWQLVKDDRERLKKLHYRYAAQLTTIRLTDEDIDAIVLKKLESNERYIRTWLPNYDDAPADAQLAIHSMAWAVGPAFNQKFPTFTAAARLARWWDCAHGCKIREEGNPGVVPRNKANRLCFENAAAVAASGDDYSVLHWPGKFVSRPQLREEDPPPLAPPFTDANAALLQDRLNAGLDLRGGSALLESEADEETKPDPPRNA